MLEQKLSELLFKELKAEPRGSGGYSKSSNIYSEVVSLEGMG